MAEVRDDAQDLDDLEASLIGAASDYDQRRSLSHTPADELPGSVRAPEAAQESMTVNGSSQVGKIQVRQEFDAAPTGGGRRRLGVDLRVDENPETVATSLHEQGLVDEGLLSTGFANFTKISRRC